MTDPVLAPSFPQQLEQAAREPEAHDLFALLTRAAALARAAEETCQWTEDSDGEYWETACGETFAWTDDFPDSNPRVKFCMYCGKSIAAVRYIDTITDEDDPLTEGSDQHG